MIKPYYEHNGITIYHGDCREIMPQLGKFDLLLTDPPYGIGRANGMGGMGRGFMRGFRRRYEGAWDSEPPIDLIKQAITAAEVAIIWGGNHFADALPRQNKWLVWDKEQTMPSYSDAELAWTTLDGTAVKMFRQCGAGLMAVERDRVHPTQKPRALIKWCIGLAGDVKTILDPFAGSGTTGRAAKDLGLSCTLIEIEEKYCEIAARRMGQEVLEFKS